jgi:hypothetical protein
MFYEIAEKPPPIAFGFEILSSLFGPGLDGMFASSGFEN